MEMQLIQDSKIYQREGITFSHPMDIAEPFFNAFGTSDYLIKTDKEVVNVNDDGSKNISYGRILFQKIFGDTATSELNTTVGIILSFDQQLIKLFAGANVSACTNLCVFNATWLVSTKLGNKIQNHIDYIDDLVRGNSNLGWQKIIDDMNTKMLHRDMVHKLHSQFILEHRRTKDKAMYGESFTNNAFADLLMPERKSPYCFEGNYTSEWNVYNALTEQLSTSKDILYVPQKSLEAFDMIKALTIAN